MWINRFGSVQMALVVMISAKLVLVLASPMPMDGDKPTQTGTAFNNWWTSAIDHALHHAPTFEKDVSPRLDYVLSPSAPSTNLLHSDQHPYLHGQDHWARYEDVSYRSPTAREVGSGSAQMLQGSSSVPVNPQIPDWQYASSHYASSEAQENSLDRHLDDNSWYNVYNLEHDRPTTQMNPSSSAQIMSSSPQNSFYDALTPLDISRSPGFQSNQASPSWFQDMPEDSAFFPSQITETSHNVHAGASQGHTEAQRAIDQARLEPQHLLYKIDGSIRKKSIPASTFLQQHPLLVENTKDERGQLHEFAVAEVSPKAQELKKFINRHLFSDHLAWRSKAEDMFTYMPGDDAVRQLLYRINSRADSWATKEVGFPQASWVKGPLVVVPHRFSRGQHSVFDPEPGPKRLLFSFWAPSQDLKTARLQFVGTASIDMNEATKIIKDGESNDGVSTLTMPRMIGAAAERFRRIAARPKRKIFSTYTPNKPNGRYATSNDWLSSLPLLGKISATDPQKRKETIAKLVSQTHSNSIRIKEAANAALFDGRIIWQTRPEDTLQEDAITGAGNVIRYHKNSEHLYLTRPETLLLLPYHFVLIPYEIMGPRARLFDPSLKLNAYTFTMWASHIAPGSASIGQYFFVGGGAIDVRETEVVRHKAQIVLSHLAQLTAHSLR